MAVPKRSSINQQQQRQPFNRHSLSNNGIATNDRNIKRNNGPGIALKSFFVFAIVIVYLNYRASDSMSKTTQRSVHEHTTIVVERHTTAGSASSRGADTELKQLNLRAGGQSSITAGNGRTTNNGSSDDTTKRTLPQFPRRPYPPIVDNDMSDNPELQAEWSLWAEKPMTGSFLYQPSAKSSPSSSSSSYSTDGLTSIHLPAIDIDTIHSDGKSNPGSSWLIGNTLGAATSDGYRPPSPKVHEMALKAGTDTTTGPTDSVLLTRRGQKDGVDGERQPNQDRIMMLSRRYKEREEEINDWWIGLFDGHGMLGHCVAQYASLEFAKRIEHEWNIDDLPEPADQSVDDGKETTTTTEKRPREGSTVAVASVQNLLTSIFEDINDSMPKFEGSGSTGISVWKLGNMIYISNVGDSLAFVASYTKNNRRGGKFESSEIELIYETQPHKPDSRRERERIEKAGGEVADPPAPGFSARLLVPHPNGIDMTGLAMSRSLGDFEATKYGLIARPTTMALDLRALDPEKEYILFAVTDGLVDKVSPTQVAQHMAEALIPDELSQKETTLPLEAAEQLILKSSDLWMSDSELEGLYRDDISLVVRRLHVPR